MDTYHLILKTSYHPDWGAKLASFWSEVKSSCIKTDEKVLFIEDDSQIELIYEAARAHDIEIQLVKE